jgi:hypothetical protein
MPVTPALGRLRQEDDEFKASLGYTVRHCLKKKKKERKEPFSYYSDYKSSFYSLLKNLKNDDKQKRRKFKSLID